MITFLIQKKVMYTGDYHLLYMLLVYMYVNHVKELNALSIFPK